MQQQQQRPDDGYIYPADGSSDQQVYPAPRRTVASSARRSIRSRNPATTKATIIKAMCSRRRAIIPSPGNNIISRAAIISRPHPVDRIGAPGVN